MENCPSLKCFYSTLGLQRGSSTAEIRTAYRKLAMKWHPDKCAKSKGDGEQAKLKFHSVQEAYSVLSDEHKRFLYDAGLYNVDDDPDVLGEMVSMMKGACQKAASTKKSSADDEFQNLKKRFANVADMDNAVRDVPQFCSSSQGNPGQAQPSTMERDQTPPAGGPPEPHPNLFPAMGCSNFDSSRDFVQDTSRFTFEFEQLATPCPQPHPNLFNGTCFYDSISDDIQELYDDLAEDHGFSTAQNSHSSVAQNTVIPSHISERFASVSEAFTTEISPAAGGPTLASNANIQGFCMGVSGSDTGKDSKGQGRCTKLRRNRSQR